MSNTNIWRDYLKSGTTVFFILDKLKADSFSPRGRRNTLGDVYWLNYLEGRLGGGIAGDFSSIANIEENQIGINNILFTFNENGAVFDSAKNLIGHLQLPNEKIQTLIASRQKVIQEGRDKNIGLRAKLAEIYKLSQMESRKLMDQMRIIMTPKTQSELIELKAKRELIIAQLKSNNIKTQTDMENTKKELIALNTSTTKSHQEIETQINSALKAESEEIKSKCEADALQESIKNTQTTEQLITKIDEVLKPGPVVMPLSPNTYVDLKTGQEIINKLLATMKCPMCQSDLQIITQPPPGIRPIGSGRMISCPIHRELTIESFFRGDCKISIDRNLLAFLNIQTKPKEPEIMVEPPLPTLVIVPIVPLAVSKATFLG